MVEIDMSAEIEKDNVAYERKCRKTEEKTARLIAKIRDDRFLKDDADAITKSIGRFGATDGLLMYAASVASDVQEGMVFGAPDKEILRQWLNVIKGCMFHCMNYNGGE